MMMVRQLALLTVMVVAAITLSLAPNPVVVRGGQSQGGQFQVGQPHAGSQRQTVMGASHVALHDAVNATAEGDDDPFCSKGGHHGSCCFAPGLPPTVCQSALPAPARSRATLRECADFVSIVSEAIPEPPKSFA